MELLRLPDEVLETIRSYLDGDSIVSLGKTCRRLGKFVAGGIRSLTFSNRHPSPATPDEIGRLARQNRHRLLRLEADCVPRLTAARFATIVEALPHVARVSLLGCAVPSHEAGRLFAKRTIFSYTLPFRTSVPNSLHCELHLVDDSLIENRQLSLPPGNTMLRVKETRWNHVSHIGFGPRNLKINLQLRLIDFNYNNPSTREVDGWFIENSLMNWSHRLNFLYVEGIKNIYLSEPLFREFRGSAVPLKNIAEEHVTRDEKLVRVYLFSDESFTAQSKEKIYRHILDRSTKTIALYGDWCCPKNYAFNIDEVNAKLAYVRNLTVPLCYISLPAKGGTKVDGKRISSIGSSEPEDCALHKVISANRDIKLLQIVGVIGCPFDGWICDPSALLSVSLLEGLTCLSLKGVPLLLAAVLIKILKDCKSLSTLIVLGHKKNSIFARQLTEKLRLAPLRHLMLDFDEVAINEALRNVAECATLESIYVRHKRTATPLLKSSVATLTERCPRLVRLTLICDEATKTQTKRMRAIERAVRAVRPNLFINLTEKKLTPRDFVDPVGRVFKL